MGSYCNGLGSSLEASIASIILENPQTSSFPYPKPA